MRIDRILIDSFGKLRNWNSPDLTENMTLVTGNNEAGKSTIMEFVRGTMFPVRSVKYPTAAKTDSGTIEITMDNGDKRVLKREQKKVTEVEGKRTVSEEFSNIDSDTYRALYALDLEQLTNNKVISSGDFRNKFLTVPGGESIPQVSQDVQDRLNELMNKEKMTDTKIIGKDIKALKQVNAQITEMQKTSDEYDALVEELDDLQKRVTSNKNLIKINSNSRERKKILMSQADNVDRLKDLKEQREKIERSRSIPLESKAEYDGIKNKVSELEEIVAQGAHEETMNGADPKTVIRRSEEIDYLWTNYTLYVSKTETCEQLQQEAKNADANVKALSEIIGWTEKKAKSVKSGRYITDKAESTIRKRRSPAGGSDDKVKLFRLGAILLGLLLIVGGVYMISTSQYVSGIALIVIGALCAAVGYKLQDLLSKFVKTDTEEISPEEEWRNWIAAEGYPANTTPESACILAGKIESLVNESMKRDEAVVKKEKVASEMQSYEKEIVPLCKALKVEHTDYCSDVNKLHGMLKIANEMIAVAEEHERKERELAEAKSSMNKFLKKYGTEDDFYEMYDERLKLDTLDRDIETLTSSIEASAGLSVTELVAFYEDEEHSVDTEVITDDSDTLNTRIGEINIQMKNIMDDETLSELLTRKSSLEENLNRSVREWAVYSLADEIITNACNHFYTDLQPSVVKTANLYLDLMTNGRYQLDSDPRENEITVKDSVMKKTSSQWSSGLGDQVFLSVKMALVKEMGAEKLPLILDDVLVRFDVDRKQGACRAIMEFAKDQQVIMFTCDSSLYNFFSLEGRINNVRL